MKKPDEALKQAELTLEKYRKNKTQIPPEDLAGKYRVAFQKLKDELASDLKKYVKAYCFIGINKVGDASDPIVARIQKSFDDNQIGKRIGHAAFINFDIEEVKEIARQQYRENLRIYKEEKNDGCKTDTAG